MEEIQNKDVWLAFVVEDDTANELHALAQKGLIAVEIKKGDITTAIEYLKEDNSPRFLLTDITGVDNILAKIATLADICEEETRLICVGQQNDINLYRSLQKTGVDDYQTIPINSSTIVESMNFLASGIDEPIEEKRSQPMLSVVGSRGGVGTSTIASSLAWSLANDFSATTCFMDFDIYAGISALAFNTTPNQGLVQALANADRLDDVFLKRLTIEINKDLSILAAEQSFTQKLQIYEEDVINLTNLVKSNFDFVVADINHNNHFMKNILYQSSYILIVSEFSISSVRDTVKLLDFCRSTIPFAKTKVMTVKNSSAKSTEITDAQFEDAIKQEVDYVIPFDRKATLDALNSGEIFCSKYHNHAIAKTIREIISSITKASVYEAPTNWLDKLKNWSL